VQQGLNEFSLPTAALPGGVYLMRLYSENGEILETTRIIRY
jgi:hypothetical protein